MSTCTYASCFRLAVIGKIASDGQVWARLCVLHDDAVTHTIATGSAKDILREWVKAQGGAAHAAARVFR